MKVNVVRGGLCLLLLFSCMVAFCGCASANGKLSLETASVAENTEFHYDAINDETTVYWRATLTNDTIYDLVGFSIKLFLFCDGEQVSTVFCNYDNDIRVRYGSEYTEQFSFVAEGRITDIEIVSWSGTQLGFWETYRLWVIIAGIIAAVGAILYVWITTICDIDLDDVWEEIAGWLGLTVLCCLAVFGGVLAAIFNWVTTLIVLAALGAFVLAALAAHGVRYVISELW